MRRPHLAAIIATVVLASSAVPATAHAEAQRTRAKAIATADFFLPLLLPDNATQLSIVTCKRHRGHWGTWMCGARWTMRPDKWTVLRCRNQVINGPEEISLEDQATRCRERRTATRGRGFPLPA